MKPLSEKTLNNLNVKVTILGYPVLLSIGIILLLLIVNMFGLVFSKGVIIKFITLLFDIGFGVVTYINHKRIKRKEISLFAYLTLNNLPPIAKDNDSILNYFTSNNERNTN